MRRRDSTLAMVLSNAALRRHFCFILARFRVKKDRCDSKKDA
jgi:hypothetical protein